MCFQKKHQRHPSSLYLLEQNLSHCVCRGHQQPPYTTAAATIPVNILIKDDGCVVDAARTPPNGPICRRRIDFDSADGDADDEFEEAIDVMVKIAELLLRTADVLIQNR